VRDPKHVVVVGGGLAGLAAATILAERGSRVTVLEREAYLGGRAGAWTDTLVTGERFEMERGFHAFFRQYYNLRALIRRVDPSLDVLVPMRDYPLLGPDGAQQSFANLPRATPLNMFVLARRTPTLKLADLFRLAPHALLDILRFEQERDYARLDARSAREYLDSWRFPLAARRILFDVFSHSFFNPEEQMSAAEMLMMFHFYFTGNPEGLLFDVMREPFSAGLFRPLARYLEARHVELRSAVEVRRVVRESGAVRVELAHGDALTADAVVLAVNVAALQALVEASPTLDDVRFRSDVASLTTTRPFVVWRMWLDRRTQPGRHPFVGTAGLGLLDNISLFHLFESESRAWAEKHDGSVVELHAYAVPEGRAETDVRDELRRTLFELYPETREARVVDERFLWREDCTGFPPGSHATRPTVETPFQEVTLAGDFVRLDMPSALMERAVTSGMLAANTHLARWGARQESVAHVTPVGLLG
jgi:isorenieratene synthase